MEGVKLKEFLDRVLIEDVGGGDHTSLACVPEDQNGVARLLVKENGVIAGVDLAEKIFAHLDPTIRFDKLQSDGSYVEEGEVAFRVRGKIRSILGAERLVLNLMQRMSGIATITSNYARTISHTKAKVLDTRKTTPGLRWFEKEAVKIGGGLNHRFGLFDMILIKDNHVDAAGGVTVAIDRTRAYLSKRSLNIKVEVEVRSMDELEEVMEHGGVDRVMLDNFSLDQTKQAVNFVAGRMELESSGGISLETILGYAETGVDFISVGALTHSVKSLDMSLKIIKE